MLDVKLVPNSFYIFPVSFITRSFFFPPAFKCIRLQSSFLCIFLLICFQPLSSSKFNYFRSLFRGSMKMFPWKILTQNIFTGKFPPRKFPLGKFSPIKLPPGKFLLKIPNQKISIQKITAHQTPSWKIPTQKISLLNIPTHF